MANQFDPNQAADLFGFNENFTTPMFQLAHNLGANHQQYPEIHNQLMVQYLFIQQQVQCLNCAQWYHVFCLSQSNREYQKAFFCCNHPSAGMALAAKKGVVFNKYWSVPNPRKMKSSSSTRVPVVIVE